MPTCPMCGEDFRSGGTFTTHVQNCDAAPDDPAAGGVEAELKRVRERLTRLEETVGNMPDPEALRNAAKSAANNYDELVELREQLRGDLDELEDEVADIEDKTVFTCGACGAYIPFPWREPSKCYNCGTGFNWDGVEEGLKEEVTA